MIVERHVRLFRNGRNQTLRIPRDLELPGPQGTRRADAARCPGALEEQLEEDGKLWRQNPQRLREVMTEGSARAKIPSLTPHYCATPSGHGGSRPAATSSSCQDPRSLQRRRD